MRLGFVAGGIAGRCRRVAAPRGGLQFAEIGAVPAAGGRPAGHWKATNSAGTLNAAGGVLVHQCEEAVRVVICACRAGAWGFVWHRTFSLSRAQSRTCSGCAGAGKRRMKFNDSPLPQTVATGVGLGVSSEFRRREEPSGLRICAWPGRGTKCSSTSVRRKAARFPCGSSWPSMRRRLRSRRNSTSAGPSSLRRALSAGC